MMANKEFGLHQSIGRDKWRDANSDERLAQKFDEVFAPHGESVGDSIAESAPRRDLLRSAEC